MMADPIPPQTKRKVKIAYMTGGLSLAAAAAKYGISERMAHEWSRKEGWVAEKLKRNGGDAAAPQVKLVSMPTARGGQQPQQPEALGELPQSLGDMVGILDEAIARMSQAVHNPADGRNRANAAQALAKLIDQRSRLASAEWLVEGLLKFYPTPAEMAKAVRARYGDAAKAQAKDQMLTAVHIAEMAMAADIKPHEFMSYLKQAWEGEKA